MKITSLIITVLLLFISCKPTELSSVQNEQKEQDKDKEENAELLDFWNFGKVSKSSKDAFTVTGGTKKYRLVDTRTMLIKKYLNNQYMISNRTSIIIITKVIGSYPEYSLDVKLKFTDYINGNYVTEWPDSKIIVHFIDKNSIWFENKMSRKLIYSLDRIQFGLEFGSDKIYYRAEEVDERIKPDMSDYE